MSLSGLSDELAQVRTKKKRVLTQMDRIIPWGEWGKIVQPCYYKEERGNRPYGLELMLRLYMLQNLYNLSDEGTVAEAVDSRAASDFCGVESSNQVPDGDTLSRFRNLLIKHDLQEKLFAQAVGLLHPPPPETGKRNVIRRRIRSKRAIHGTLAIRPISV